MRIAIPLVAGGLLAAAVVKRAGEPLAARFTQEVGARHLTANDGDAAVVAETDIISLPAPVQRYMRFMGVVGRARDWSFRAHMSGTFRTSPEQKWAPMEAWQYDSRTELARLFYLKVRMFGFLPVLGRDTYLGGQGRMLIRPLDLFTVSDARGDKIDISELVTYLNDAILLAPSFLLGPETTWSAAGPDAFDVAFTYAGHTVTAQVFLDDRGAPRDFSTSDRFVQDPFDPQHPFVRARWTTPIDGWQVIGGRPIPTSGRAIWHLPQGEFAYVGMRFAANDIVFNVAPGR
jgi:uncharacterized protein DUF6544